MKSNGRARESISLASMQEAAINKTGTLPQGFFYGWIIVGCTFAILFVTYGIQYSYGVFMPFISAETGWKRGTLSAPYSVYVFLYSILGLVSGRLTDRLGPRKVLTAGGCLLGAGIALMSVVHAVWQMYIVLGVLAALGMSAAYVPCNATVVRWFERKRGLALSITSSGASFGLFSFPPVAAALIAAWGWRTTYATLGCVATLAIAACATFIVRDPEEMGLHLDGLQPRSQQAEPEHASLKISLAAEWTLAAAKRTPAFWLLNVVFGLTWLVVFMPMVHLVPFALDLGIPHFRAAMTLSIVGCGGTAGRLMIGPISDRLGRVFSLGACLFLQLLSFGGFVICSGSAQLYPAAVIFGFSAGGISALFPSVLGDFFGRIEIGAIVGFIFALAGSPAAFGPMIGGYLYDVSHSYTVSFILGAALNLMAFLLVFLLKKPKRAEYLAAG